MPHRRALPAERVLRPLFDDWQWQEHGACRGTDTELFFPPDGERAPRRLEREATAKALCAACPVRQPCRAHALGAGEPYGVWGGLSAADRELVVTGNRADAEALLAAMTTGGERPAHP